MTPDYDAAEAAGLCECGQPDDHPIDPPPPWQGWRSGRVDRTLSELARRASVPGSTFRRRFSPNGARGPRPQDRHRSSPWNDL